MTEGYLEVYVRLSRRLGMASGLHDRHRVDLQSATIGGSMSPERALHLIITTVIAIILIVLLLMLLGVIASPF
jgi:hypothetical protein